MNLSAFERSYAAISVLQCLTDRRACIPVTRDGLASVSLGSTKEICLRLVADGRFENLPEACRAGLRRLAEDARVVDLLTALSDEGIASGIDDAFNIDAYVGAPRTGR